MINMQRLNHNILKGLDKQNNKNFNIPAKINPKLNEKSIQIDKHQYGNKQSSKKACMVSKFLKRDNYDKRLKQDYSQLYINNYNIQLKQSLCKNSIFNKNFLQNHQVTPRLRSKMIDWIIQVLSSYKVSNQAFFKSVWILDNFLKKVNRIVTLNQLHIIGVTCMFISCKYQQVQQISLDTFCNKICRHKFTKNQILNKQCQILIALNFKLEKQTILIHINYFIHFAFKQYKPHIIDHLNQVIMYLAKMSLIDYDLAQNNNINLSLAIIFVGMKTIQRTYDEIQPQIKLKQICSLFQFSTNSIIQTYQTIQAYHKIQNHQIIQNYQIIQNHQIIQHYQIIQTSKKVLQLAQNYTVIFPELANLKRFHKFSLNKKSQ